MGIRNQFSLHKPWKSLPLCRKCQRSLPWAILDTSVASQARSLTPMQSRHFCGPSSTFKRNSQACSRALETEVEAKTSPFLSSRRNNRLGHQSQGSRGIPVSGKQICSLSRGRPIGVGWRVDLKMLCCRCFLPQNPGVSPATPVLSIFQQCSHWRTEPLLCDARQGTLSVP